MYNLIQFCSCIPLRMARPLANGQLSARAHLNGRKCKINFRNGLLKHASIPFDLNILYQSMQETLEPIIF